MCWGLITMLLVSGCATSRPPRALEPPVTPAEQKVCEHFAERAKARVDGHSVGIAAGVGFGVGAGSGGVLLLEGSTVSGQVSGDLGVLGVLFIGAWATVGGLIGAGTAVFRNDRLRASAYADAMDVCLEPVVLAHTLGPEHPGVARSLLTLGYRYWRQADLEQAELLYQRALAIQETVLGPQAPEVATTLDDYAALLRQTNRVVEAVTLEQRARAIRAGEDLPLRAP